MAKRKADLLERVLARGAEMLERIDRLASEPDHFEEEFTDHQEEHEEQPEEKREEQPR